MADMGGGVQTTTNIGRIHGPVHTGSGDIYIHNLDSQSQPLPSETDKDGQQIVLLIHGIRTQGDWQEMVRSVVEETGVRTVVPLKYGFLDAFRFWCPFITRRKSLMQLLWRIEHAIASYPGSSVVIVAHSFGTWAITQILKEKPNIRPDRLILCGAIVPQTFRWDKLPNCPRTINECGSRDIWPILASSLSWGYGATGTFGFGTPGILDRFHDIGHSDYFRREFVEEYWKPFICDGVVVRTEYESRRPPTPWWRSLFAMLPLRWLLMAAIAFAVCMVVMYVWRQQVQ